MVRRDKRREKPVFQHEFPAHTFPLPSHLSHSVFLSILSAAEAAQPRDLPDNDSMHKLIHKQADTWHAFSFVQKLAPCGTDGRLLL